MVKGISRQVIMVRPPEPKLFEQAIFILRDDAIPDGITDEMLLREARWRLHPNVVTFSAWGPSGPAVERSAPVWFGC